MITAVFFIVLIGFYSLLLQPAQTPIQTFVPQQYLLSPRVGLNPKPKVEASLTVLPSLPMALIHQSKIFKDLQWIRGLACEARTKATFRI